MAAARSALDEATREAVTIALQEAIARREQRKLLDLEGSVEWVSDYDYKTDRLARDRKLGLID